jgi:hypothetical protein
VIVSLQSWWCPWCHAMNKETWANADVRATLKDHFIPVYVDQDSRPDISQRYERWGWPATIIFGPDGTEIVKLRGFYSPQFLIPVLQETISDPSPVDYGNPGGPERERTLTTGLSDAQRAADPGLHRQGLRPGQWRLEQEQARRRPDAGLVPRPRQRGRQGSRSPIEAQPHGADRTDRPGAGRHQPGFAETRLVGAVARVSHVRRSRRRFSLCSCCRPLHDPTYRAAADRLFGFLKQTLAAPGGGFYASMGMAEGQPGVDKRQYARETGQAIQGLLAY